MSAKETENRRMEVESLRVRIGEQESNALVGMASPGGVEWKWSCPGFMCPADGGVAMLPTTPTGLDGGIGC